MNCMAGSVPITRVQCIFLSHEHWNSTGSDQSALWILVAQYETIFLAECYIEHFLDRVAALVLAVQHQI